ncbi:hypothetical protein [Pseudonocardia sp. H11422]|uniref:hypothetical protein n=1 Tax=Pseudonocardia sp. H11422 TaxID=2835866 RepID=UPI001BDD3FCF|nr:hypothetical protein [Pseudonocardia sp. H11422]
MFVDPAKPIIELSRAELAQLADELFDAIRDRRRPGPRVGPSVLPDPAGPPLL